MRWRTPGSMATAARAAAAALLILVASSILRIDWVPLPVAVLVCAVGVLAAFRPAAALLIVAGGTPVAAWLLRGWNPGAAWAEALVVAFGAGWATRRLLAPDRDPALPPALAAPVRLFTWVVVTSAAAQLAVDLTRLGGSEFAGRTARFLTREYFVSGSERSLHAAAFLLEGLLLFGAAARLTAERPRLARRLGMALAAGGAAAAAINFAHLVRSAARSDHFWRLLWQHLVTARLNVHYADVNAAGSVFALLLFVAAGLAAARGSARLWGAAAGLIGLGLWMTASRTALFACPVALAITAGVAARRRLSPGYRPAAALAALLLLAAAGAAVYAPARGNQKSSSIAAQVRVGMAGTTWRMLQESPLVGIGLGQFYQRSGEFSSPALLAVFPRAQHENAHNNFLQILAETGLIGLAGFLWLLFAAVHTALKPLGRGASDGVAWGAVAGLTAFLLTCLGGHPLLTREAASAFWLVLGLAAGCGLARDTAGGSRAASILIVALVLSLPWQVASARRHADFEHLGIGLSEHWEMAYGGVRYRSATNQASLFVPGDRAFRFSVRVRSTRETRIELRLDGRTADILTVQPDQWTDVTLPARSIRPDARFSRLDLRVVDAAPSPVTIWVSKVEPL